MGFDRRFTAGRHHLIAWQLHTLDSRVQLPVLYLRTKSRPIPDSYRPATEYLFSSAATSKSTLIKLPTILGLIWDCLIELELDSTTLSTPTRARMFISAVAHFLLYGVDAHTPHGFDISALRWRPRSGAVVSGLGYAFDDFVSFISERLDPKDPFVSRCPGLFSGAFSLTGSSSEFRVFAPTAHHRESRTAQIPDEVRDQQLPILNKLVPKTGRKTPYLLSPTKRFPKDCVVPFLSTAFRYCDRCDATGEFTARLLLGACRSSEYLNVWDTDLAISDQGQLVGFLRSPSEYVEPGSGLSRRQVLWQKYETIPRPEHNGKLRAGFKSPALNSDHWAKITWLAGSEDFLRQSFVKYVLTVRAPAMKRRREIGLPDHPYLLVFPTTGDPYTLGAFRQSWERAVNRFSKRENVPFDRVAKYMGSTIHGVRHLCGKTWSDDGIGLKGVQKILHHRSITSSSVYTIPDDDEIHEMAEAVKERIRSGELSDAFRRFDTVEDAVREYVEKAMRGRNLRR